MKKSAGKTVLVIMIILSALSATVYMGGFGFNPFVVGMGGVLCTPSVPVVSNDAELQNLNYQCIFTLGGSSSVAWIPTSSNFQLPTGAAFSPTTSFPFKLEGTSETETWNYQVTYDASSAHLITDFSKIRISQCRAKWDPGINCKTKYPLTAYQINYADSSCGGWLSWTPIQMTTDCVFTNTYGESGSLENPTLGTTSVFTLTNSSGRSVTATVSTASTDISNGAISAVEFKEGGKLIATITNRGGLSTGTTWKTPGNFQAIYSAGSGKWYAVSAANYGLYKDAYNKAKGDLDMWQSTSLVSACTNCPNEGTILNDLTDLTAKKNAVLTAVTIVPNSIEAASSSKSSGSLTYTLTGGNVLTGDYILNVYDASWLGIITTVGMPDIVNSPTCTASQAGATAGSISLQVKNVGTASDYFQVSVSGCTVQGANPAQTIAAGSTYTFPISVQETSIGTKTCTLKVCSTARPSNCDSTTATCTVTAPKECAPDGIYQAYGMKIQQCQSGQWVTVQTCPSGSSAVGSAAGYTCTSATPGVTQTPAPVEPTPEPTGTPTPPGGGGWSPVCKGAPLWDLSGYVKNVMGICSCGWLDFGCKTTAFFVWVICWVVEIVLIFMLLAGLFRKVRRY